ncbi:Aste57867_2188 [Aphanomyces stellatus]|uniref:Aste57867_2188 protein n=1 Tax=Aphanomyces stellatus TaxID=120398 RepID=A0A485KAQ1_9STRA|nr:hypothetical protein As57867_002183 [Aphanomyces stellatus]VFT79391.1 Aste57867_2188 [Aphanomyces stellatus]
MRVIREFLDKSSIIMSDNEETKEDHVEKEDDEWKAGQSVQVQHADDKGIARPFKLDTPYGHRDGNVIVTYSTGEKEKNVVPSRLKRRKKKAKKSVKRNDDDDDDDGVNGDGEKGDTTDQGKRRGMTLDSSIKEHPP